MHKAGLLIYLRSHLISIGLSLIIIFYLINGICYVRSQSITSDEGSFYTYAVRYLKGNPARIIPVSDNSKMPVAALNTIPRLTERLLNPTTKKTDGGVSDIMHGRYVTLLISLLTIFLVFMWSSELYGKKAGLFSAWLMSICPNHLANAGLVTTDAYSVLFLVATMYCLWKYCTTESNKYFILFSILVAASQLVKQSLFHLYILSPICLAVYFGFNPIASKFNSFLRKLIIFLLINWLVINLAWYFYQSFWTLRDFYFLSELFRSIQSLLPGWLPVPFPKPFIDGLDLAKYYDRLGGGYDPVSAFGNVTIMGHSKTGGGYWYYYFISIFYKTPIAYFILLVWTTAELFKRRSFRQFIGKEFFLFAPVAYFLIALSFFYQTQTGLRHIIFIYPFLFISMGIIIPAVDNTYKKGLVVWITGFLFISVMRYWENYFPYTNEFIADKKMAFQYVGAANLDFKQGGIFLQRYLRDHPNTRYAPAEPQRGIFVISVSDYLDIWNRHGYDWLLRYKPAAHVAYTYLVFRIDRLNPNGNQLP